MIKKIYFETKKCAGSLHFTLLARTWESFDHQGLSSLQTNYGPSLIL